MYRLLILMLAVFQLPLHAQDVLMAEEVLTDSIDPAFGPNYSNYSHFYLGFGMVAGNSLDGSPIKYGMSIERGIGLRYKWKFNRVLSAGFNLGYSYTQYQLKQDSAKTLPNQLLHKKEKLSFHNLYLGVYQRINWGKRGNYIGNFIDLGGRFYWPFAVNHVTKDQLPANNINNGNMVKVKTSNLAFTNPYYYCAALRIGFNRYVLSVSYRLSPLFKTDPNLFSQYNNVIQHYEELPLLIIGIEVGLHQ